MKKIMIAAGGTGGHIFPGLAVAKIFLDQGDAVVWVGTKKGLETRLVPEQGIRLLTISMQGLRGKGIARLIKAPLLMLRAVHEARCLIKQESPDLILGMGGYVSAPVGVAARLCGVPLVIHEQNAIAGLSNKLLSRLAYRICVSFPNTFPASDKIILSGNPVRGAIAEVKKEASNNSVLNVLVLGGSLGAKPINQVIPDLLIRANGMLNVWHQTGVEDFESVKAAYGKICGGVITPLPLGERGWGEGGTAMLYKVEPFISDMASAYAWADIIICRAGATTVAELAILGLSAILIPLPHAVDDHQTANARHLVRQGSAVILPQSELSSERLLHEIHAFLLHRKDNEQSIIHAPEPNHAEAASKVVQVCKEVMA
ncbi:MAG: UDP-N-acetylglucosamine--N-acetylmuramyl-(pentapeptide) pyrophosphoryl-undecaprenol N-acetylglucosamine transferase [Gammaproteobacteria bacterium]|nr:UDP-N-acetylglucosamine--N-acetylmuramyl-(pentapeptide) pyrophosphoryl-undecaprenol N-acetylglucosamine transferase [Gammaproteobacteria bacterium]